MTYFYIKVSEKKDVEELNVTPPLALTKRGKEEDLLSLLDVVIGGTLLYDLPIYIHIDG